MKQKYYLALTTEKWRLMIEPLNNLRNRLVSEGRYTDTVDEVLIKGSQSGPGGQRHLCYLKEHRRVRYANLLTTGKLNDYLADLNEQAEAMFSQLVKLLAEKEGVTESSKQKTRCFGRRK